MDLFYFSILIDVIVEQARQLCMDEIALLEMELEMGDIEAELDEIGAFLDAAGV